MFSPAAGSSTWCQILAALNAVLDVLVLWNIGEPGGVQWAIGHSMEIKLNGTSHA
jgi:hypothetical protein